MSFTSRMMIGSSARDVSFSSELASALARSTRSTAGQPVTPHTAIGVPAIGAAVAFRATSVAMLDMSVYTDDGDAIPSRVTASWQARLLRGIPNPNQSWYEFWETVESSLSYRGNAYIWKTHDPVTGRVTSMTALHPDQVFAKSWTMKDGHLEYPVLFAPWYPCPPEVIADGISQLTVDDTTLWHIRGRGSMGEVVAPSPIERYAASIGVALAKQDYEANLYSNGILGGTVVSFPATITHKAAAEWKKVWNEEEAGTTNAGSTKVIGGGATVANIGMTQRDADFVASVDLSVLDVCNIFGVPASFLNQNEKAAKAVLPEHEEARWVNHYLAPELRRIESSLFQQPDIFGPSSKSFPRFDSGNGLIHPDSATKASILATKVQTGQWTPDEARSADGMPPLPDGYGAVPIYVPVGGTPYGMPNATQTQDNGGNGNGENQ